jgi:hypothetical protein
LIQLTRIKYVGIIYSSGVSDNSTPPILNVIFDNLSILLQGTPQYLEAGSMAAPGIFEKNALAISCDTMIKVVPIHPISNGSIRSVSILQCLTGVDYGGQIFDNHIVAILESIDSNAPILLNKI